ncbi:MAG: PilZ domain-containing protein [Candidatus Sulfotelmatobacter sp.]|jgi:hypothetical protein
MAEEINEGVAYLRALKQSGGVNGSGVEKPAAEASSRPQMVWGGIVGNPGSQVELPGAEKRRSPRYKCEGSVELREEGCDVRTWATFSDISLHGCYVEAQATYPAGTALHMKLEANGFKVETKGTVRVNYPYLGMGIAFAGMSDEDRARLRELLGSISQPSGIIGPGIASALPATGPLEAVPRVSNPQAAIGALLEFFESRQMLMRDDFLRILRSSQSPETTP